MSSRTMPAIMKMVVKLIIQAYDQDYSIILDRQLSGS
jgi:hypothetical protein